MRKTRQGTLRSEIISALVYVVGRTLYKLSRVKLIGLDAAEAATENGGLFITWHGDAFVPGHALAFKNHTTLASLSRDGDIQARVLEYQGYTPVRGSTGRGGARAALEIVQHLKNKERVSFTPDGPRGPRCAVQKGVVYFAQKSQTPIIPMVTRAESYWRIPTWDRYMLPKPFGKVELEFLPAVYVSKTDNLEEVAAEISRQMLLSGPDSAL